MTSAMPAAGTWGVRAASILASRKAQHPRRHRRRAHRRKRCSPSRCTACATAHPRSAPHSPRRSASQSLYLVRSARCLHEHADGPCSAGCSQNSSRRSARRSSSPAPWRPWRTTSATRCCSARSHSDRPCAGPHCTGGSRAQGSRPCQLQLMLLSREFRTAPCRHSEEPDKAWSMSHTISACIGCLETERKAGGKAGFRKARGMWGLSWQHSFDRNTETFALQQAQSTSVVASKHSRLKTHLAE